MLRKRINPTHPIIGHGYRLLEDWERLALDDETACVTSLLSLQGDTWRPVLSWVGNIYCNMTVGEILGPDSPDADKDERLFRRRTS